MRPKKGATSVTIIHQEEKIYEHLPRKTCRSNTQMAYN